MADENIILKKAIDLATKAKQEHHNGNYEEALILYNHTVELFLNGRKYEAGTERTKKSITRICISYQEHAKAIEKYLNANFELEERVNMLKLNVGKVPNTLTEDDYKALAMRTKGFSEADIENFVCDALMQPFRKVREATHFKRVKGPTPSDPNVKVDDLFAPCSSLVPGAIEMTWVDVPGDKLCEPSVTMNDITLKLYNHSVEYLLQTRKYEARDEEAKQIITEKCISYQERAKAIEKYLNATFELEKRGNELKQKVIKMLNTLTDDDYKTLAVRTKGFSEADIKTFVCDALMQPFRKVREATHFRRVKGVSISDHNVEVDDLFAPCSSLVPGAIEMTWVDVPSDKLCAPSVTMNDMMKSLAISKPL